MDNPDLPLSVLRIKCVLYTRTVLRKRPIVTMNP